MADARQLPWILLTRPRCQLCEEFAEEFAAAFPGVEFESQDVDSKTHWRERYGGRIPVLLDEREQVICETVFDLRRVASALDRA